MRGIEAAEAIAVLAVFLGGIVFGVIAIVSLAINREDRKLSLGGTAPDFTTHSARVLIGVGSRGARIWER